MTELTIKIESPELTAAILQLANAISGSRVSKSTEIAPIPSISSVNLPTQTVPAQLPTVNLPAAQPATIVPQSPVTPAVVPLSPATPIPPQMTAQTPVATPAAANALPTAGVPEYNMDQLAVAATGLMEQGKQPELLSLLTKHGVQALTQLPKEQYGAFATDLRAMGARI